MKTLNRADLIRFHKSLRKANDRYFTDQGLETSDYTLKYYSVGEYGTEHNRPHYHSLVFNLHPAVMKNIERIWGKGIVYIGGVSGASINYVTKYMIDADKRQENKPIVKPFSIMSKGIGANYLKSNIRWHKDENDTPEEWRTFVMNEEGFKYSLPRYYRERIFDEAELELLRERQTKEASLKHITTMNKLSDEVGTKLLGVRHREKKENLNEQIKINSLKQNTL